MPKAITTTSPLPPQQKIIEEKFAAFEESQLSLLKALTLDDILHNVSPYLLLVQNATIAAKIVIQALDRVFDAHQREFFHSISNQHTNLSNTIELIGYSAKLHNATFAEEKAKTINRLTNEFYKLFCEPSGTINWEKLVEWNSGNFDLDTLFNPKPET